MTAPLRTADLPELLRAVDLPELIPLLPLTVTFDGGRQRRFEVFRVRRSDVDKLTAELDDLVWRCLVSSLYGPAPEHMACSL